MWKFLYKTTDAHKNRPHDVKGFLKKQTGSKYYIYALLADDSRKVVARYNTKREADSAMDVIIAAGMTEIKE